MWKKRIKRQCQRIPIYYLILALLSNILPFARPVEMGEETKERLDRVDFRGGEENGPDRVTLLETPTEALEARLAVLKNARETIDITYYKIISGSSTDAVLGELLLAADRGVQVRILVDGRSGDRAIRRRLELLNSHPNISYRRYNPVSLLRPWKWQAALHDKFIIVDGTWLLLGGRNLGDRYYDPRGYDGAVTNDRDVLVWRADDRSGEAASVLPQATAYMEELWNCRHTTAARQKPMGDDERQELLDALDSFRTDNPRFFTKTLADYCDRCVPTRKVTLIHNPTHTGKKEPEVAYQMARVALEAQEQIVVQTPYTTANTALLRTMTAAGSRAQDAVMLTNSLSSSPNYPAFSNYHSQRDAFTQTGFHVYEYQSADSIHGKSMLVDGRISAVGSFNLDDRSMFIDTESMLVIDSEEFAAVLGDAMGGIQAQSLLVSETGRGYVPGQQTPATPVKPGKRALMGLVSVFSRLFQFFDLSVSFKHPPWSGRIGLPVHTMVSTCFTETCAGWPLIALMRCMTRTIGLAGGDDL